jgi:hypothetical protein
MPSPGGDAEPSARWGRLEHMGRSAGQTEMDAVADLQKFAAWERIVEGANRVFTIQAMRIVRQPAVSIRTSRSQTAIAQLHRP